MKKFLFVAFESVDGTLIMLINDSDSEMSFDFSGLKGSSAEVYSFIEGVDGVRKICARTVTEGTVSDAYIPSNSVNIIISR